MFTKPITFLIAFSILVAVLPGYTIAGAAKSRVIDLTAPKGKPMTVIEEGDTDEYMFRRIADIAVDSVGNIYVLDAKRIMKYNPGGKFVSYIGSFGEGPGEFKQPRNLFIDGKSQLFILDIQRIIHYDAKAAKPKFIKHYNMDVSLFGHFFVHRGDAMGISRSFGPSGVVKSISKVNLNTGKATQLFTVPDPETKFKRGKTGGVMGGLIHEYSSRIYIAPLNSGYFTYAANFEPQLKIMDKNNKTSRIIDTKLKNEKLDDSDIAAFEKRYGIGAPKRLNLPPVRPIFDNILTDERNNIYAVLKKPVADRSPVLRIAVFKFKGKVLYHLKIDFTPLTIRRRCVYGIRVTANHQYEIRKASLPFRNTPPA